MPIKLTSKVDRRKIKKIMERHIADLLDTEVLVGIPAGAGRAADALITLAQIGYIQEFGSPASNIPARPFLIPGVESVQQRCAQRLKAGLPAALAGGDLRAAFNEAGLIAATAVKNRINDGIPPKLADATLAARKRKGFAGTKPLVVTGGLRNAVTHVVRSKRRGS